jgi:DNA processing protein
MTTLTETAALVTLLRTGRRPWNEYAELVEDAGSALAVLADDDRQSLFPATDTEADLEAAANEIAEWQGSGMQLLSVLDEAYPDNLRAVHDRPPLIFVAGRLAPEDARAIAVVGSRNASPSGRKQATRTAAHLVRAGFTVASGLATGIDTAAHTTALTSRGRTIAVIGTGLKRTYPPQNQWLQKRIASECAVVSQFWPDAPPSKRSFPMRNAVMSGLTIATVVVEAAHTSGARMQARLALAQGRPVFLPHSLLTEGWARECAARPGAHVFHDPDEITAIVERLTAPGLLTS